MKDITLVIPAKSESDSLPKVLNELKKFSVKKIIVIPKNDILTFKSAKKYNCKIIFQKKNGYGSALSQGILSVKTKYFCIFNADGAFNPKHLKKMKKVLGEQVKDVKASSRLKDSPSCIVADSNDPTAKMQELMKAMGQPGQQDVKPILEIINYYLRSCRL